ncbi:hypothetical protein EDC94DRAFT_340628 [Helicostylum pulchrum]|nr:hypothetical protein EDC94DRAFT_340628 [Helicostylum pulchrum]
MSYPYTLTPFLPLPNCDLHEQLGGSRVPCEEMHAKIIALRVYFVLVVLNLLFVVFTTFYFIHRLFICRNVPPLLDMTCATNENISKQWRIYSLKKRNIFGSILGALGHLIFVTTVLIYQVVITPFSCDIFLWGPVVGFLIWVYALIWRTRRLHLLIRINELQRKYHVRTTPLYDTKGEYLVAQSIKKDDKDYKWFMKHKGVLSKGNKHHIFVFCCVVVLVTSIIVLAEYLGIWIDGISRCEIYVGNYIILGMVLVFFAVVVPFIFWYLRDDEDAHGIRKEIWVTVAVGVPCSIICIIWQTVFEYPTGKNPAGIRGLFGPCNWLIILTTTNHIMTIVLPVFKTLYLERPEKTKFSCIRINRTFNLSWLYNIFPTNRLLCNKDNKGKMSTNTLGHSMARNGHKWELTVESLLQALNDPDQLSILKSWAVKDFTVENILFYDRYLDLLKQIKNSAQLSADHTQLMEESGSNISRRQSQTTSLISQSRTLSNNSEQDILSIPIEPYLTPQVIDFYNTFIVDQSPLQVNITHKARTEIEAALAPLCRKMNLKINTNTEHHPGIPAFLQSSFYHYHQAPPFDMTFYETFCSNNDEEKDKITPCLSTCESSMQSLAGPSLTIQIFEQARKEVFWNIFSGLFPKVVESYNIRASD